MEIQTVLINHKSIINVSYVHNSLGESYRSSLYRGEDTATHVFNILYICR